LKDSNWPVEPVEEVGLGVRQELAMEIILDNSWIILGRAKGLDIR
jgi:hypothetical protein